MFRTEQSESYGNGQEDAPDREISRGKDHEAGKILTSPWASAIKSR